MSATPYRIGVDVGGTNTDSVILDIRATKSSNRGVIAQQKTPTTSPNVTDGIETAIRSVLEQANIPREEIACLIIGTTHFVNAIVEQDARRLAKVAIIRLSKTYTREVPPFSDFPPVLKEIMNGHYGYVDGGLHIDGSQEAPIKEAQVVEQCAIIKEKEIDAVVISGIFSPIDDHFHQEDQVRKIILRELPGIDVVCSSEVSQLGLLERENASILNVSILKFARRTIRGFKAAMKRLNLTCALYLTQNDGTLIDATSAARLPIRTFSSGPTNSMRGAAYLGGIGSDGNQKERTATIVVDIGGTTSDIGMLLPSGFPRQSSAYVTVAGVKVNFGMPHVESIGLGGGSIVRVNEGKVTVGPDSVGNYLTSKATVFGGDILTATDIGATGENIGDAALVKELAESTIKGAQARIKSLLERVVDIMKTSPAPLPVLLVGGGSIIAPKELAGVSNLICPPYHSVANAVGAAISKVGGTIDIIQSTADRPVSKVVEEAKATAIEKAVAAGAVRETIYVAEVDTIPLQYVANQVRIIVRAVGELSPDGAPASKAEEAQEEDEEDDAIYNEPVKGQAHAIEVIPPVDIASYRPKVVRNPKTGVPEWFLSETDAEWLSDGCYVLGCAGGGSPYSQFLRLRDQLRQGHTTRIIDSTSLPGDAVIYWGGYLGSPSVSIERLAGDEADQAFQELMEYMRHDSFDAVMGVEIGGANGLQPLTVGSTKNHDRPVVDADWMGRAYPTGWQTTLCVYAPGNLVPCSIASGDGRAVIMTKTNDDRSVDDILRASCVEMGSSAGTAGKPTTADRVVKYAVRNTLSLAWRIGRCIARAHATNMAATVVEQMIDEVGGCETAKILFRGKIVAVERRLYKGHSYGELIILQQQADDEEEDTERAANPASIPVATGGMLKIPFKNENIFARHVSNSGVERYVAMVPDLIAVLDTQSGRALGVPEFRYGVMVTVLGIACSPRWTDTPRGLEIGGPAGFGYEEIEYRPLGRYVEPRSVVMEFVQD
ncbi:hypothetical protein AJ80_06363 [Polytolypa hystricis UAMH7299]|uniref:Hydantoinase/oxoprolinase n=1 Tax=Polytolypa hystricis (strain UAMH7299) TaxID=1447883 RepID=A0A2B7XWQ5_POLH7|nr:hypothetical protein AJ80_06363 [Polytolypa hystricis UAMH7299]